MKKTISLAASVLLCTIIFLGNAGAALPDSDQKYLKGVYEDTWRFLDHFTDPDTGFPYDASQRAPSTSITNIGFYMASCAAASKTGLLTKEEALTRLKKCFKSISKVEKWRGFPVTWMDVHTLQTTEKQFSTIDHLGNFCASLILVKNIFPELKAEADAVLSPMDWSIFYEPKNSFYKGGYRLDTQDFDVHQSWGEWYYSFLGADTRLGSFIGVAKGEVPLKHWESLNREKETKYGMEYYVPGWQGGGLFMQYTSGLFMDERRNDLGRSARNFAEAQIKHAGKISSPVWGWSAAVAPSGEYLGWGAIKDEVVTPHASALASIYFSTQAASNLRKLEELGARPPFLEQGTYYQFGFRDSIDWKTGQVSQGYLSLDQAMLFLSLANLLYDGVLWKNFEADPLVQKGKKIIPEYSLKAPKEK